MKKVLMNMANAREKDQLKRMKQLQKDKKCFFCKENYLDVGASPVLHESTSWYIKKNDYPYTGSIHHYLIVPKKHIRKISDIHPASWPELLLLISWLEKKLKVKGYSMFVRAGDMQYTGGTIDHLHFHFLVGGKKPGTSKLTDNILITLGHKKK